MALCKLQSNFLCRDPLIVSGVEKKRRDFFARQGTAKSRPGSALVCAEETRRSRDAVWRKKTKFFRRV